eukprot:TRINITY_DN7540_c0_g1_i2.p1 TRINITY_DN7540_c0_g1~~TRINITY_DN7540_c0_g1_i2.p1  ORF type:complete len:257 (+),score=125.05 TRINITY_DN7540_c0_g1_i2:68-772(+)
MCIRDRVSTQSTWEIATSLFVFLKEHTHTHTYESLIRMDPKGNTLTSTLSDGRKVDVEKLVDDLKTHLYKDENTEKYFPKEKKEKYERNFKLFDRNSDDAISYSETLELLRSIGQNQREEDVKMLFDFFRNEEKNGISLDDFLLIVFKKIKDDDKEAELADAFRVIDKEDTGIINSENFKDLLMTTGYKFTEEMADEFLKEFDPKGDGKFAWQDFVNKIMKPADEKKKKKAKKE